MKLKELQPEAVFALGPHERFTLEVTAPRASDDTPKGYVEVYSHFSNRLLVMPEDREVYPREHPYTPPPAFTIE